MNKILLNIIFFHQSYMLVLSSVIHYKGSIYMGYLSLLLILVYTILSLNNISDCLTRNGICLILDFSRIMVMRSNLYIFLLGVLARYLIAGLDCQVLADVLDILDALNIRAIQTLSCFRRFICVAEIPLFSNDSQLRFN